MTKVSENQEGNNANTVLCNVVEVDKIIKQLSKIQVKLMQVGITNEEYNEVTDFIHNAKEYLANMQSYKQQNILQMNNIQKLVKELVVEEEKARKNYIKEKYNTWNEGYYVGKKEAFSSLIQKLELLLKDESNQPQPPISQTQMLGEVPQVGHSNISESSTAVEGETRLVGQNEQTNVKAFVSGGHRCNLLSTASCPPACTNAVLAAVR